MPHKDDISSYLFQSNFDYIEELYEKYLKDPLSVDEGWISFFKEFNKETAEPKIRFQSFEKEKSQNTDELDLYRRYGHKFATLDPLGLQPKNETDPLPENVAYKKIYSGSLGFEFMHLEEESERAWWIQNVETPVSIDPILSKDFVLEILMRGDLFEKFLHNRFQGAKRFSLEGGEALLPGLQTILTHYHGKNITIGMSHRGRLNVISHIVGKPYQFIFERFIHHPHGGEGIMSGDVKYHLGAEGSVVINNEEKNVFLSFNPSHLEAVNGVVLGMTRALREKNESLAVLIHGDASFMGQGVVAETLNLSQIQGYEVGGTLHIVVNNQVGFTTNPSEGRSTRYCTDVAKMIGAPIIHAKGDDPENFVWACFLALEYRRKFKKDVVLDLVCFRKWGHNEGDEPLFTQPLMYHKIAEMPPLWKSFGGAKNISDERLNALQKTIQDSLQDAYEKAQKSDLHLEKLIVTQEDVSTGVSASVLKEIAKAISFVPENFELNPKIQRQWEARLEHMGQGKHLEWGTGEVLAFGSLLKEGFDIRLSGQDAKRGTFSHRHSVVFCQNTGASYTPLSNLGSFEVLNSPLSEFGVMAFEYGYADVKRKALTIWEAQFGDFANGAQTIIDQFLSSGESKWGQRNSLALLLPHGYEGQGPEHSSARLERFLQLCAEYNMQVCYPTTPANMFHLLRRQVLQESQKPLVVMTPKSLLRHRLAVSDLKDFEGTFQKVLSFGKGETIIFCSGKVYYDLIESSPQNVQILRLEELYPFPVEDIKKALNGTSAKRFVWAQEEPQNMGSWSFVKDQLQGLVNEVLGKSFELRYVGRRSAASPASGFLDNHIEEQKIIIQKALGS